MADKIIFNDNQELLETLTLITEKHQPLTLESTVEKKANKKNRDIDPETGKKTPFTDVFKGTIYCTKREYVSVYNDYVKATENKYRKEGRIEEADEIARTGKVKSGELPWGEWYKMNLIITHKENFYLRYYQNLNANYQFSEFVMHYEDGEVLSEALVERYWNEFAPKKEDEAVETRVVKFAGITRAVLDNKILIRAGHKNREDKGTIFEWHTLAEKAVNEAKAKAKE